jgi:hypothetical protein
MRFTPFALSLPILLFAATASAQQPSIDVRTWRPSTDPGGGMVLEPTTTPGPWNWNVGTFLNYSYRPVSFVNNGTTYRPVEDLLGLDIAGSLGLGSRVSIGAALPLALYATGDKNLPSSISGAGQVPATALGDLSITGKASLVDDTLGGFGLAAIGTLGVPTGSPDSFMGYDAFTFGARLVAEYTLLIAQVQASLGYNMVYDQRTWPDASAGGIVYGNTIPWSAVVAIKPAVFKLDDEHRQRWELGFHGWVPGGPIAPFTGTGAAQQSPAIVSLGDRIELGHYRDAYALAGVEVGMTDAIGTPAFRAVLGIGWAPRNHDADNDGVPDDLDQCPELPEDKDGFEDNDGCPEIDNDDDGILDKDDACPNQAGSPSPDPRKNGCPQPDRDKDGVPDDVDACPDEKGIETDDPKTNGCPRFHDRDKDGIPDKADRCPDQPEDADGVQDDDGCPDPDNDGDGIADIQDACPKEPGDPSPDPKLNGCPNPDRDGDTYDNGTDKCPDEPETFNGVQDDDGCPDTGGKPLVTLEEIKGQGPRFKLGPKGARVLDEVVLRAIVAEANKHREWTLLVATQAAKIDPKIVQTEQLVANLNQLAHRQLASAVLWERLKDAPVTSTDAKILIEAGAKAEATPAPLPPAPKP